MKATRIFFVSLLSLLPLLPGNASPLLLDYNFTGGITHAFTSDGFFQTNSTKLGIDLPDAAVDLNTTDSITLNLSAPGGQRFSVTPHPTEQTLLIFYADYKGDTGLFGGDTDVGFTHSFLGLEGAAPSLNVLSDVSYRSTGRQFVFNILYEVTGAFTFTGWTATAAGPFTVANAPQPYQPDYPASRIELTYSSNTDDGPGIVLEAIPEASSVALLLLGVLGLSRFRKKQ